MKGHPTSVVVLGGGPGGYEAALVAARLGASVTVVDRDGLGGACVLTDCVPSKALISTAGFVTNRATGGDLGVGLADASVDLATANRRILDLAEAQSNDIAARLTGDGVRIVRGTGTLLGAGAVRAVGVDGTAEDLDAEVVLLATGSTPRTMPTAQPDGERILTWQQIYSLTELPEHLVVVGSGVTGAELAHAYVGLGARVTLVSSRDRVLPGEDADAATVIEDVFRRDGMEVLGRSRMASVERTDDGVCVTLTDGRDGAGFARAARRGLRRADVGNRVGGERDRADRVRSHRGRRGLEDLGPRRVCGGGLHRRSAPGLGGGDAGADRHVARVRRRCGPAPA